MLAAVHPPVLFQIREGFLLAISCSSSVLILFTATFSLEMILLSPVTCFYLFIKKKQIILLLIITQLHITGQYRKAKIKIQKHEIKFCTK
jgi:hypothetical protein